MAPLTPLQLPPHTQVKASSFPSVVEELARRYRNALLKPSQAATALRLQLLSGGPAWSHDELAAALEGVKGVEEVQVGRVVVVVVVAHSIAWHPFVCDDTREGGKAPAPVLAPLPSGACA